MAIDQSTKMHHVPSFTVIPTGQMGDFGNAPAPMGWQNLPQTHLGAEPVHTKRRDYLATLEQLTTPTLSWPLLCELYQQSYATALTNRLKLTLTKDPFLRDDCVGRVLLDHFLAPAPNTGHASVIPSQGGLFGDFTVEELRDTTVVSDVILNALNQSLAHRSRDINTAIAHHFGLDLDLNRLAAQFMDRMVSEEDIQCYLNHFRMQATHAYMRNLPTAVYDVIRFRHQEVFQHLNESLYQMSDEQRADLKEFLDTQGSEFPAEDVWSFLDLLGVGDILRRSAPNEPMQMAF